MGWIFPDERERRALRLTLFTGGYLVIWASAGVLAFALGAFIGGLSDAKPSLGTAAGVGAYLVCGLYQLSPLKYRCLQHCRSPLSLVLKYGSYRGSLRDFRVGLHHGGYCLGCCWSLMVVLLALGAMSIVPMVVLATVVMTEKLWIKGENFSRLVGVASLALASRRSGSPDWRPGFAWNSAWGVTPAGGVVKFPRRSHTQAAWNRTAGPGA